MYHTYQINSSSPSASIPSSLHPPLPLCIPTPSHPYIPHPPLPPPHSGPPFLPSLHSLTSYNYTPTLTRSVPFSKVQTSPTYSLSSPPSTPALLLSFQPTYPPCQLPHLIISPSPLTAPPSTPSRPPPYLTPTPPLHLPFPTLASHLHSLTRLLHASLPNLPLHPPYILPPPLSI